VNNAKKPVKLNWLSFSFSAVLLFLTQDLSQLPVLKNIAFIKGAIINLRDITIPLSWFRWSLVLLPIVIYAIGKIVIFYMKNNNGHAYLEKANVQLLELQLRYALINYSDALHCFFESKTEIKHIKDCFSGIEKAFSRAFETDCDCKAIEELPRKIIQEFENHNKRGKYDDYIDKLNRINEDTQNRIMSIPIEV
jgi:hypothetical protein